MKRKYYINNKKFHMILKNYNDEKLLNKNTKPPLIIFDKIMKIVYKYINRHNFRLYSFRDIMISEALYHCTKAIDKYNPYKFDNPLAFFTRVSEHAFQQIIKKEKKNLQIKRDETERIIDKYMPQKRSKINNENFNNFFDDYNDDEWSTLKVFNKNNELINKFKTEDEFKNHQEQLKNDSN